MDKFRYLFVLLLIIVALSGCKKKTVPITPSGRGIRVGVIGPMSGPSKSLGWDALEGIKTSLDVHPYLKNGDKVELIVADDRNKPDLTVKVFKRMVQTDKVAAILLLSSSASCLAVNAIADRYKTPILVVLGTHPEIARETRFVSQLCFDNTFQGRVAALFVHDELLIDRVAVVNDPSSFYSGSLTNEFVKKFIGIGGDVTDIISLSSEPEDLKKILTQVRKKKPTLLYLPIEPEYIIRIIQTLQVMGWHPECMASDGLMSKVITRYKNDIHLLNGLLAVDFYSSTIALTPYGEKMVKRFHALYRERGTTFNALGIEGMDILIGAMNRCPDPKTPKCISEKIRDTKNFCGIMGKITIKADGKAVRPLIVSHIKKGRIIGAVKVY